MPTICKLNDPTARVSALLIDVASRSRTLVLLAYELPHDERGEYQQSTYIGD